MLSVLFTCVALLGSGPEVELQTLAGTTVPGQLESLSTEEIVIRSEGQLQTVAADQVLQLVILPRRQANAPDVAVSVELIDGSVLPGAEYVVKDGVAALTMADKETLEVPTRVIRSVRLGSMTAELTAQWDEILAEETVSDCLVIRKNESLDYVEGVLGDATSEQISFDLDGDVIGVKRTKVAGLVYYHARDDQRNEPICDVRDTSGTRLRASQIVLGEGHLAVTTSAGPTVEVPLERLARIDFSQGKVVYLSDLDWEGKSDVWAPYFPLEGNTDAIRRFHQPRRDRGFTTEQLHLGGQLYRRGLGLFSRTELVYRLDGPYRRLVALAGLDDEIGDAGHVVLTILGDRGKVLFEAKLSGTDDPLPVEVDLTDVRRLTIVVDYGDDLDVADHLYLCEARIFK
jgi:hypothetical protein